MTGAGAPPDARAQIAGLTVPLLLLDAGLTIVEANAASEDMLGVSARRLAGRNLSELMPVDDAHAVSRAAHGSAPIVARAVTIRGADGDCVVDLAISPVAGVVGWRTAALFAAPGVMPGADREPVRLAAPAVLAHEIKNPLAAIRGAAQLLARRANEQARPMTDLIVSEVARIAALIDRMQRIGSRSAEPNVALNLHEAVRRALASVRAAGLGGVELVEEFDPSLPSVVANRDSLEQVVIILVTNAREACADKAAGTVIVRTRYARGLASSAVFNGSSLDLPIELTVSDNGPGIDEALRGLVFEPFVSGKKGGQGLGLALADRLVRDMHGRIGLERDERAGLTHFRVNLPVRGGD